jgi:hypothetical protein
VEAMSNSSVQNFAEKRGQLVHLWRKHGFKLLSIGLSLIALITAWVIHSSAIQSLTTAKGMLQQQQAMNAEAEQSASLLSTYLPLYNNLQKRRVIAPPERLQWLETLQAAVNENLIPKLTFVLSPTTPASSTNTVYTHDTLGVKVTAMRLEFTLLHEGDLLRLLNDMHTQAKGEFSVQNCELTRGEEQGTAADTLSLARETFKGTCDLQWYSLSDITSAWEVLSESH